MRINLLFEKIIPVHTSLLHIEVKGIAINSSLVCSNELFVAIPGFRVDGHDFIEDAVKAGATVIVGEKDISELALPYLSREVEIGKNTIPYIQVPNSRATLAELARRFYGNPSHNKKLIGVTGTNGKTTIAFMIKHILETNGHSCSLFGSVFNEINGQKIPSLNTTPDALELQKQMFESKDEFIIMEVSSHGLSQRRIDGLEFDLALFTNLDYEHLDFHKDMEEYFSVKASLFNHLKPNGKAIINTQNDWGKRLSNQLMSQGVHVLRVGDEELQIKEYKSSYAKVSLSNSKELELHLDILGKHNVLNACMAFLTVQQIGISEDEIIRALKNFPGVPGRFELVKQPNGATVVIDYAHTADAFHHCLETVKEHGANRIFHIFGFRGNRDNSKRMSMVEISRELCDFTILTLDDLNGIPVEEMEQELYELHDEVVLDRTLAIKQVLSKTGKGDWICITGKGAENYKEKFQMPTSSDKETVEFFSKKKWNISE